MISWLKKHRHRIATAAVTVGAFIAAKAIPVAAVLTLGPLSIPVVALVEGGIALAGAVGVAQSPTLRAVLEKVAAKR